MIGRGLVLLALAVLFLGPLAALFAEAGPDAWREVLDAPAFPKAALATVLTGGAGALLSVLAGLGFALLEGCTVLFTCTAAPLRSLKTPEVTTCSPALSPSVTR